MCALPGNFLVLRKMSLLGDAISHAVLPGIAIAFLITQSRQSPLLFISAVASGMLVALTSAFIQKRTRSEASASLGAVFSVLFALGLVLIHFGAEAVDLDPSCVLYGALELAPLDTMRIAGQEIPRSLVRLAGIICLNGLLLTLFFKEINMSSFDAAFAENSGVRADVMRYIFIAVVAITTVAVFELVGSILVIAMLVAPAATALLISRRLINMIMISLIIAVISASGGYLLAITVPPLFGMSDTNAAGVIAALSGICYMLVLTGSRLTRHIERARSRRTRSV